MTTCETTYNKIIHLLLDREIRLRKQHIRDGVKGSCKLCPVALAIREVLHEDFPEVDVQVVLWYIRVGDVSFANPERVARFIDRFDHTINRESLSSFRFTLTEVL